MGIPQGWELVLILAVVLLLFGAKRLPDSARSLGRSMRIFKAETKGLRSDDEPVASVPPAAPVTPAVPAAPLFDPVTGARLGAPAAAAPASAARFDPQTGERLPAAPDTTP